MKMFYKLMSNYYIGCVILRYLSSVEFSNTDCRELTEKINER